MRSIHTEATMSAALGRLYVCNPYAVFRLTMGPTAEPGCRICETLLDIVNSPERMKGMLAAAQILDYHDEATYLVEDPEDFLVASGLGGIWTYARCLKVYDAARKIHDRA